jgi:tungstate transport system ATP-binding protein
MNNRKKPIVEVRHLEVVLGGQRVLEIPSLQVYPNQSLVVIGPNGSGKTTLLLCLALLLKPAGGTICYKDVPVLDAHQMLQIRRRNAVVFQESLLLNSSVWDNVTLGLRLRGIRGDEASARALKWLERFGIASLARRQARTLSGGESKRVSLARAFALQPEVLFLDEPFNALDSPTHQKLVEDFESVLRETKVTTLMVTHDRNEAIALANRVAVVMNGQIRQLGSTGTVFSAPVDEEVAGFIEVGNIMHGMISSRSDGLVSVDIRDQQIETVSDLAIGTQVALLLKNDDIIISLPSTNATCSCAHNRFTGRIVKMFPIGSMIKVTIDCGFILVALVTRHSWDELDLKIGQIVIASFKALAVRLIPQL